MSAKILIVEDHEETRQLLGTLLEIEGYSVVFAEDGQAGYEVSRVEEPDLILTDIGMLYMDGIEMIRMIRESHDNRTIPVIVITAYGGSTKYQALEAGANAIIDKPLQFDWLLELIRKWIPIP